MIDRTDYEEDDDLDLEDDLEDDLADDLDEGFDNEFDATARRFSALKSGGRRVLGAVAQQGKRRIVDAADRGKHRIADRLEDGADYLRNDIEIIHDDFITSVQRNPLMSAGIAIGVGFLLGKALTPPAFGRGRKKGGLGAQLSRAIVSSAAALAAARLKDSFLTMDEPEPPRRPPRRGSNRSRSRPRRPY